MMVERTATVQAFVHSDAFTHTAGGVHRELRRRHEHLPTALFDANGDANADMAILLTGDVHGADG